MLSYDYWIGKLFNPQALNPEKSKEREKVSERSERAFWKTRILAMKCMKWLQT